MCTCLGIQDDFLIGLELVIGCFKLSILPAHPRQAMLESLRLFEVNGMCPSWRQHPGDPVKINISRMRFLETASLSLYRLHESFPLRERARNALGMRIMRHI